MLLTIFSTMIVHSTEKVHKDFTATLILREINLGFGDFFHIHKTFESNFVFEFNDV